MFKRFVAFGAVATVLVAGLSGCASVPPVAPSEGSSVVSVSDFSSDDMAFMSFMLPRSEQALKIAALAETNSDNPDIKSIASSILETQGVAVEELSAWVDEAKADGVTATDLQKGDGLNQMGSVDGSSDNGVGNGLVSDAALEKLADSSGYEFNKLFLEYMINFEEYSVASTFLAAASNNYELKAFAENVVLVLSPQLQLMRDMYSAF